MTQTDTDAARSERNRRARERRADERYTLDYAEQIRAHKTPGTLSENQQRVVADADAILRKRAARNADARERRLRASRQREYAQRRAEQDAADAAYWQMQRDIEQRRIEQRRAERVRIRDEQDAELARLRAAIREASSAPERDAAAARYQAAYYFTAAERDPIQTTRWLKLAYRWQARADRAPGPGPDDEPPASVAPNPRRALTPRMLRDAVRSAQPPRRAGWQHFADSAAPQQDAHVQAMEDHADRLHAEADEIERELAAAIERDERNREQQHDAHVRTEDRRSADVGYAALLQAQRAERDNDLRADAIANAYRVAEAAAHLRAVLSDREEQDEQESAADDIHYLPRTGPVCEAMRNYSPITNDPSRATCPLCRRRIARLRDTDYGAPSNRYSDDTHEAAEAYREDTFRAQRQPEQQQQSRPACLAPDCAAPAVRTTDVYATDAQGVNDYQRRRLSLCREHTAQLHTEGHSGAPFTATLIAAHDAAERETSRSDAADAFRAAAVAHHSGASDADELINRAAAAIWSAGLITPYEFSDDEDPDDDPPAGANRPRVQQQPEQQQQSRPQSFPSTPRLVHLQRADGHCACRACCAPNPRRIVASFRPADVSCAPCRESIAPQPQSPSDASYPVHHSYPAHGAPTVASADRPARLRSAAASIERIAPQTAAVQRELAERDPAAHVDAIHHHAAPADPQGSITSCGRVVPSARASRRAADATCAGCRRVIASIPAEQQREDDAAALRSW